MQFSRAKFLLTRVGRVILPLPTLSVGDVHCVFNGPKLLNLHYVVYGSDSPHATKMSEREKKRARAFVVCDCETVLYCKVAQRKTVIQNRVHFVLKVRIALIYNAAPHHNNLHISVAAYELRLRS